VRQDLQRVAAVHSSAATGTVMLEAARALHSNGMLRSCQLMQADRQWVKAKQLGRWLDRNAPDAAGSAARL
jgi:hypothetical protein